MSKYAFQDSDKTRDLNHLKEVIDFAEGIFRGVTPLLTQLENRGNHVNL
jgi:hypothetical protein